jgi:RimJ/RimL family protein N-acetyltransferase
VAESPVLVATRLRLEPFAERHLSERYVAWLNDPEVVRFSEQRLRRHSLESCRTYMESFAGTPDHFWAAIVTEQGLGHVGNLTARIDEEESVADVAILIGERRAWGHGYATEAWLAVTDYMLRTLGLARVTAGTMRANERMLALMRRTGMAEEGGDGEIVRATFARDDWLRRYPDGPFP